MAARDAMNSDIIEKLFTNPWPAMSAGLAATVYSTGVPTVSAFALDARGRLWLATSAASDHSHDAVYMVARSGARPQKVIAGVRGPLGLDWYRGRLYVTSLGRVDAFSGLRNEEVAVRLEVVRAARERIEVAPELRREL